MPCTTILVGKKASYDGSTMIARNDDSGTGYYNPKKWVAVEPDKQPRHYASVIAHLKMELPNDPLRYVGMPNAVKGEGIWAACGVNSENVGMTATETITTNERVLGADPLVRYKKAANGQKEQIGGIGEEDLVVIVLPYIHSAREGVLRLGELLEKYGTYETNGIAFSDVNEIWWFESIGGHHWIAKKVEDDKVVIMPNQFGLDNFDLNDAFSAKKNNLCSSDLREFIKDNHLDLSLDGHFNPRVCFGSHSDSDHVYNTPRAFALLHYFAPHKYIWDDINCGYTPESDDLPWAIVPEKKVTVEDVKYGLSYHYQGTQYDPYLTKGNLENKNKYRSIGINRTSFMGLVQIRPYVDKKVASLIWLALGSCAFNAAVPFYSNIDKTPSYLSNTTDKVTTDNFYWANRIIAALADSHYNLCSSLIENYQEKVQSQAYTIIYKYDKDGSDLVKANQEISDMTQKETDKVLNSVLYVVSNMMKNSFSKSDK